MPALPGGPNPIQACMRTIFPDQIRLHGGWASVGSPVCEQGWKLHVSATICSALPVLERILPILAAESVCFKVAASLKFLTELNDGHFGQSQVGKFVTVYPRSDAEAVRLAVALQDATAGLTGPQIPSDQQLRPGSLVHYRYGAFKGMEIMDELGRTTPAIRNPNGQLVPDVRGTEFTPPSWAIDPFRAAGLVVDAPAPSSALLAGRYLMVGMLQQVSKGGVYVAIDTGANIPRTCVMKEARHDIFTDLTGRDIRDRLRYQKELLERLSGQGLLPEPYDLFELEGNVYLTMEELQGRTLLAQIPLEMAQGQPLSTKKAAAWGGRVAYIVARLHEQGILIRDLKPGNIMIAPDESMRLIDLELVYEVDKAIPPFGWGTAGYCSPQQAAWETPTASDDIYSLGGVLFYIATGQQPAFLLPSSEAVDQALTILNPDIPSEMRRLIAACRATDSAMRPSIGVIIDTLQRLSQGVSEAQIDERAYYTPNPEPLRAEREARYRARARGVGDLLVQSAEQIGEGCRWGSTATTFRGASATRVETHYPVYIHTGTSGTALFLADLYACTGDVRYRETAEGAARWLMSRQTDKERRLPGLYFGEAGVGAFLLRLGQVTHNETYIAAAMRQAHLAAAIPSRWPDLTHGAAGRGLLHLLLAQETGDAEQWRLARAAGDLLLQTAIADGPGVMWLLPESSPIEMGAAPLTGFAHGVAGIGYFLAVLAHATGDERYLVAMDGAARWLLNQSRPVQHPGGESINWPMYKDGREFWVHWCHGCAGIGQFFLTAWAVAGRPEYRTAAEQAARTTCFIGRKGNPTQCHGLSGNGEFLLDMYQALHDPAHLQEAETFAALLEALGTTQHGVRIWSAETATCFTPDYMVGYTGVAYFLLRLSDPLRIARPLTYPVICP